jgi:hypothetical protein
MKTKQIKITISTYEEFIVDPERKALLDKEYAKLELSELIAEKRVRRYEQPLYNKLKSRRFAD